jgi:hypothetical protein
LTLVESYLEFKEAEDVFFLACSHLFKGFSATGCKDR